MRFKGLDLNHLVTLEVLLVERHLTRASDRLNLTQPAVSNALTKLREHFDDPLLVRRGREMCPTPFAEQLLKPLQETLRRIHEIAAARPRFDASTASREFKIVASDYITTVVLAPLMLKLRKIAPHVRVHQVSISDDAIAKFCHGDADALIQPDGREVADFPSRPLFTEHFVCIVAVRNHSVGSSLTPEEFYSLPRVVPPHPRYWPDEYMDHTELAPALSLSFPNIPLFVANSDHVAVIPERLAEMFEAVLPIRRVRLTRPLPSVDFTVKFHAAGTTDPFVGWMLDQIQDVTRWRRLGDMAKLPTLRLPTSTRGH